MGKEINSSNESIQVISEPLSGDSVDGVNQAFRLQQLSEDPIAQVDKFEI